jgi:signal peptidase II
MIRSLTILCLIAAGVLALDLWTKRWATEHLAHREPVEVIGEYVRLTYTRNSGVAFGLGAGKRFPYYLFSIAAAVVILFLFVRQRVPTLSRQVALALILGGALGNLVDRLSTGEVVDFIEVGWHRWHWPVFNVADSAVSIGVVLFGLAWSRGQPAASAPAAHERSGPSTGILSPGDSERRTAGSLPRSGADQPLP